jgi:HK97 family phage major capsid protein
LPTLLDRLRDKRIQARTAADEILTRAADESRDLTADEWAEHARLVAEEREAADALDAYRDEQLAELRAAAARQPAPPPPARGPVLTREQSVESWAQTRGLITDADKPLSFDKFLRGIATGNWEGAAEERALSEGTLTAGGHLVPTPLSARVIDLARNATRVFQADARTVPMTAQTLKLARLTSEGTPAWKAENAAITDADMTFDSVTFTARTLVRLIKLSVELFEDSDPSAEDIIARSFASQLALELDRVALLGSGTAPEPRGVLNMTGVTLTDHGANGSNIASYDWFIDAKGSVLAANFEPNAHIVAPRTVTSLGKLKDTTNQYLAAPPGTLPLLATKQIPVNVTVGTSTDTSYIFTADWSQLMVGIRTEFNLQFLRERFLADNLQYAFLAYLRADVQLAQPAAFVVDRGVRA